MANFFIDRPVFAWVIALVIMMAGILSLNQLPIQQYPTIAPPVSYTHLDVYKRQIVPGVCGHQT